MAEIIQIRKETSEIESARGHLADMVDVINSIKVYDDNSLTLKEIAVENVGIALDMLNDYIDSRSDNGGKSKKGEKA